MLIEEKFEEYLHLHVLFNAYYRCHVNKMSLTYM